jgi:hypothetical protein
VPDSARSSRLASTRSNRHSGRSEIWTSRTSTSKKPVIYISGQPIVDEAWGDNIVADRRTLRRAIARVTLARSGRSKYTPMSERVNVAWR